MPDDLEFLTVIESLDTPEKICEYMKENFTYEPHIIYTLDPYTLWKTNKGDCNDFSTFAVFAANYHNYETYQIKIFFKDTLMFHTIAIYREDKLSYSDNWIYCYGYDTFKKVVIDDMKFRPSDLVWKSYKVYDYENNLIEVGE